MAETAVWLLLGTATHGFAQDYTYTTNNGAITITRYIGTAGTLLVPSEINGLPVTVIDNSAFQYCASLTNVTIPPSVSIIGHSAFYYCGNLVNITIPGSVTSIGYHAFTACTSLSSIAIPGSVTNIGDWAFSGCTSLMAIDVAPQNPAYTSTAGVLFDKNQTTLLQWPGGKGASYVIPSSVTTIAAQAFYYCSNLTSVAIPATVTSIGAQAFYYCSSLTNVAIGNGVTNIGEGAFCLCLSLGSVVVPSSVTAIGPSAFYYCSSLTGVYFAGNAPAVGSSVFDSGAISTVYYLPGTAGWTATYAGRPTALWMLSRPIILTTAPDFGIRTNRFGFVISWATNRSVAIETSTNLAAGTWVPVGTNTLIGGSSYFSDPAGPNDPVRFYRIHSL